MISHLFISYLLRRTGETSIHVGLNKAVDELLQNGRHGVEKEIVLITDGKSDSSAWTLHDRHHMQRLT